jgi:hypothetical protein
MFAVQHGLIPEDAVLAEDEANVPSDCVRCGVDSGASIEEAPMGVRSRFFAFTYDRFSKGSEEAGLGEMRRT